MFDVWRIEQEYIQKGKQLGEGAFCRVYLGKRSNSSPADVALKEIKGKLCFKTCFLKIPFSMGENHTFVQGSCPNAWLEELVKY